MYLDVVSIFYLSIVKLCYGGGSWNYALEDSHGPNNWNRIFPTCDGENQSPIDIPRTGLPIVTDYAPLKLEHYDLAPLKATIINNGHTAKMTMVPVSGEMTPMMSGGGLGHSYKFAQVHFHWGEDESKGSEHLKSSSSFPMEMHLVHYKATHADIGEALAEGAHDSLAVLGVFFSVDTPSQVNMPSMDLLAASLEKVTEKNSVTEMEETFPISDLIPKDLSGFYRYNGSLTTPSCNEIVQWTVLKKPVFIKLAHLIPFRKLLNTDDQPLVDNFRPVQPIGSRTIYDVSTANQDGSPSEITLYEALKQASVALKNAQEAVDTALEAMNRQP